MFGFDALTCAVLVLTVVVLVLLWVVRRMLQTAIVVEPVPVTLPERIDAATQHLDDALGAVYDLPFRNAQSILRSRGLVG